MLLEDQFCDNDDEVAIELPINSKLLMLVRDYIDKGRLPRPKVKSHYDITPEQIEGYLWVNIFKPQKSKTVVTYNWRTLGH
jgi:hypothetical protein